MPLQKGQDHAYTFIRKVPALGLIWNTQTFLAIFSVLDVDHDDITFFLFFPFSCSVELILTSLACGSLPDCFLMFTNPYTEVFYILVILLPQFVVSKHK